MGDPIETGRVIGDPIETTPQIRPAFVIKSTSKHLIILKGTVPERPNQEMFVFFGRE